MKRVFENLKLATMALATAAVISVAPVQSASADMLGGLIGATAGGFVGSTIGKGSGKLVATAAGAVIGYGIGDHVTSNHDRYDSYDRYGRVSDDYYEPRRTVIRREVVRPVVIERPVIVERPVVREVVHTRVIETPRRVVYKQPTKVVVKKTVYKQPRKTVVVKKSTKVYRYY